MNQFRLDPLGGIAGDMFVAALIDFRPDLASEVECALHHFPLLEGIAFNVIEHNDGLLRGKRFLVEMKEREATAHHHVFWRDIRNALERSDLPEQAVVHAVGIFSLLAKAEADVHGTTPDEIAFHEVGAWDSIADVVAASALITAMGASRWSIGALPLGGGRVKSAHGLLSVPAPATALLLADFPMVDDGIEGERVTPTGAAIVRYLCNARDAAPAGGRVAGTGHGFGSRILPGASNCLRVLCLNSDNDEVAGRQRDQVAVLECEIDDQSAEDIAQAIDRLRAEPDVLDLIQLPVFGKKGRMMTHLRVLARPFARERVTDMLFHETKTIGVRHSLVERSVLARSEGTVRIGDTDIRFKRVERPDGVTVKAEADDLANVRGSDRRDSLRAEVTRAAHTEMQEDE